MSDSHCDKSLLHTADYVTNFETDAYLECMYSDAETGSRDAPFPVVFVQSVVDTLQRERKFLGNQKALEFGGGPALWASFLLAQYVELITFCDYSKTLLNFVTDWIEQKPNAFDWTAFFERVLAAAKCPKEERLEWEARLREALRRGGLSTCDVNDPKCPILNGENNDYDIIFSSLCLESACLTIEIFNATIKRLVQLLKPGGLLLLLTVRNESFYYVDGKKFFVLPLDEKKLEEALNATGEVVDIHIQSFNAELEFMQRNTESDFDGKMVTCAYKSFKRTIE